MKDSKYLYHNEAIGMVGILSVLKHLKRMSNAKALLIIPILVHRGATSFLKHKSTKVRSLEELIAKKPDCFSNFSDRYTSLLPISINSILILTHISQIKLDEKFITYNESGFDFKNAALGEYAQDISLCSEKLAHMLKENDESLYLQLRVKL